MTRNKKKFGANSSGQLLVVAALAIAMLISSTTIYVYELSKETSSISALSISNSVFALKQSTRNTVLGSLVNISNGGEKTLLATNLNALSQVLRNLTYSGFYDLVFTVINDSNYESGIWLSWDSSDFGVSSAYTNFALRVYGIEANTTLDYAVNITTAIAFSGYYTRIGGDKLVNLTCNVYNEGKPALAKDITLFYQRLGSWLPVDASNNSTIVDYGNGTYNISFTVKVPSSTVQVSAHVFVLRGIFVRANTTCYEV